MKPLFLLKIIIHFLLNELKLFFKFFEYIFLFSTQNSVYNYLIFQKKNYKIVRSTKIKNILKKNLIFCKENFHNQKFENQILITSLLHSKLYSINNIIIGINLSKILNKTPVALIKKNDFGTEIFMRSFGIEKFYYLSNENIISRFKYLCLSISLLKRIKNINELLKFKYENFLFEYEKLIDRYNLNNDDLYNNLRTQISLNDRHTINYKLLDQ